MMMAVTALSAPENSAFQQGLAAIASDRRGLISVLDAIQRLFNSMPLPASKMLEWASWIKSLEQTSSFVQARMPLR